MPVEYKRSELIEGFNENVCKDIVTNATKRKGVNSTDRWQIHTVNHEQDRGVDRNKDVVFNFAAPDYLYWTDSNNIDHYTPYNDIIKISTYDSSKEGGKKYKKSKKQTKSKKSNKSNKSKKNKNQRK
jgi:hypothetical protein